MSVESTVDYAGYALSTTGTPLVDRTVTLKRVTDLGTVGSVQTDADGKWFFNDIAPSPLVKAEISAGTTPQIAVKACWSGDVWSLYVREKLTAAPAAIFNLPAIGNIYANGVALAAALGPGLDGRYVNVAGDVMTGNLNLTAVSASMELGSTASPNTPLLDFHSSGNVNDYDSRIIASGGAAGLGLGTLSLYAATTQITGTLALANGAAATPSLSFATDPNTGLYRSLEGAVTLVTNGTAMLTVQPGGVATGGGLAVGGALTVTTGGAAITGNSTVTGHLTVTGQLALPSGAIAGDLVVDGMVHVNNALVAKGIFTHDGSALGFYGAGGFPKPTVSGPKAGNAALTSLCAALATLGLITNSTS